MLVDKINKIYKWKEFIRKRTDNKYFNYTIVAFHQE